jgi:hypothetical protein
MDRTKSEEADDWWGMRKNGTPFDRMPSERNGTNRRDAPVGLELFTTTLLSSSSEMGSTGLEISLEGVPITLGDGAMVRIVELERAIVVAELVRNPTNHHYASQQDEWWQITVRLSSSKMRLYQCWKYSIRIAVSFIMYSEFRV